MLAVVLLLVISALIVKNIHEDERVVEVKAKYKKLREHLINTHEEDFRKIYQPKPLIIKHKRNKTPGYNTNKGSEIGLCLDGTVNDMFHVLLHELVHCVVEEYSHSEEFWNKFAKLTNIAVQIGVYTKISEQKEFCGSLVIDK